MGLFVVGTCVDLVACETSNGDRTADSATSASASGARALDSTTPRETHKSRTAVDRGDRIVDSISARYRSGPDLEEYWRATGRHPISRPASFAVQLRLRSLNRPQTLVMQLEDAWISDSMIVVLMRKGNAGFPPWIFELRCPLRIRLQLPRVVDPVLASIGVGRNYVVVADSLILAVPTRLPYEVTPDSGGDIVQLSSMLRFRGICVAIAPIDQTRP